MYAKNTIVFAIVILSVTIEGCSISKNYNADKKFPPQKLKKDYTLLRHILESKHPALYWYTPKDSMNTYFDLGYKSISDSMTELQFGWNVLAPLLSRIHCGHTSFAMSAGWNKFVRNKHIPSFPLFLKTWKDSMIVSGNLNTKDTIFKKGTIITGINGMENKTLINHMFSYLPQDGYENNINFLRLSTGFPFYHRNIFGIYKKYSVDYIDNSGNEKKTFISFYNPGTDTLNKVKDSLSRLFNFHKFPKPSRKQKLESLRNLGIDRKENTATLNVYTFSKAHLKHFFKRSFKKIGESKIQNLIIDIRGNGGGDISNYVALTRFVRNAKFKVSDSTFAVARTLHPYTKYIKSGFLTNIGLRFLTSKKNGLYHFGYWERHVFFPRKMNHFDGKIFILTNGYTFSASSLFCNAVKGQENVTLVGENTGGGWYGNSGIFIPEIILPVTKLRVRLPLFRIIQYNHVNIKGTGVPPDVLIEPSRKAILENKDLKIEKVRELILNNTRSGAIEVLSPSDSRQEKPN